MTYATFAATAALALILGNGAMAESNNLASVELPQTPSVVRGGGTSETGSESYPAVRRRPVRAGDRRSSISFFPRAGARASFKPPPRCHTASRRGPWPTRKRNR